MTSSEPGTNTETQATSIDYSAYEHVLDRYRFSLGKDAAAINQEEINIFLTFLDTYRGTYTGAFYVQTDFDKDGTDELAIALGTDRGTYNLLDLYTISKDGALLRLSDQFRRQGPGIGEKVNLFPLSDGSYSLEYKNHASNYRYDPAAKDLVLVGEEVRPAEAQDLKILNWQPLQAAPNSAPSTTSTSNSLDIDGLLAGDFSSIAGTWRNAKGNELVFNATGLDEPGLEMSDLRLSEEGYLSAGVSTPTVGGFILAIVPIGVDIPAFLRSGVSDADLTDQSQVRIVGGNGLVSAEYSKQEAYYRVN